MEQGFRVLSVLIAGPLFYGAVGWVLDQWLHSSWWLPTGLILGMALGVYLVIVRYGRSE